MSLINCPECGSKISNEASYCPSCGFGSAKTKSNSSGLIELVKWIAGITIIIIAFDHSFGIALLFIILGLFILPPSYRFFERSFDLKLSGAAKWLITIFGYFFLSYIGESVKDGNPVTDNSQDISLESSKNNDGQDAKTLLLAKQKLPDHKIISTEENSIASKVSINVRIYKRLSQEELVLIAKSIKSQFPNYRLTFILYFLPQMEPGAGAWATSHYDPTLSINIIGPTQAEYDQLSKDYKTDKYSSLKKLLSDDYNSSLIGDDFEIISDDKNNPIIKIYPLSVLGEDNDVIEEIIRLDIVTISMFSFTYLNIKSISVIAIPNQLTYEEPGNRNTAKWTKLKPYETKVSINRNNAIAVIKKWKLGFGFHDLYDDSYGLIGMPTGKYNIVMGEKEFFDQLIN